MTSSHERDDDDNWVSIFLSAGLSWLVAPEANIKLRCFIVLVNKDGEQFDWLVSLGKGAAVTIM